VAQPDGGRDALQRTTKLPSAFIVFQVKFVRNPGKLDDPIKWITDIFDIEATKIDRLIQKGASRYILVSNYSGTAHLDKGSIDLIYTALKSRFSIDINCLWRDDIERRLDGLWDIKLSYPEVLSGSDFLRLLLETTAGKENERQTKIVRAFLADQYQEEIHVKFRQIDLNANIFDLFIDLPFSITLRNIDKQTLRQIQASGRLQISMQQEDRGSVTIRPYSWASKPISAATFILHHINVMPLRQLIVHGGPGQGKSTLMQYICQIHRMRWLQRSTDTAALPEEHLNSPLRIPVKVDFRDFAAWITATETHADSTISAKSTSAETFIAHTIQRRSGGAAFTVDDLISVAGRSPLLIVFDGLDEVADVSQREQVVNAVSQAATRLREANPETAIIATSRPAAFTNSPGFPEDLFPVLELGSVTMDGAVSYSGRWATARNLPARELEELRDVLVTKAAEPHIRDLTKNPMQLAIVLNLIHQQGPALPDKRTALYDEYINLFFGREAAKSLIVRDNIELLKDIHRFLGWTLHCAAEVPGGAGRIAQQELQTVLTSYLEKEGHSTEIVPALFTAVAERVVMIVQKIQGMYEFEVQPLREYFAGRYLYNTASYSPTGKEKSGTKPDRFEAMSRNAYWLNVTRFYAGCYSKGELADLAEGIVDLIRDPEFGLTRHGVRTAAMLISDWVFQQSPRAMGKLVDVLCEEECIRRLLLRDVHTGENESDVPKLAVGGARKVVEAALDMVARHVRRVDVARRASAFVRSNLPRDEIEIHWLRRKPKDAVVELEDWLRVGDCLHCLGTVAAEKVYSDQFGALKEDIQLRLYACGRIDLLQRMNLDEDSWTRLIFERPVNDCVRSKGPPLYCLPTVMSLLIQPVWANGGESIAMAYNAIVTDQAELELFNEHPNRIFQLGQAFAAEVRGVANQEDRAAPAVRSTLETAINWCARRVGDRPALLFAAVSVCLRRAPKKELGREISVYDEAVDLSTRVRAAHRMRKDSAFWLRCFNEAKSDREKITFYVLLLVLCGEPAMEELLDGLNDDLNLLNDLAWSTLEEWTFFASRAQLFRTATNRKKKSKYLALPMGRRLAFLLAARGSELASPQMILEHIGRNDSDVYANELRLAATIQAGMLKLISHEEALEIVRQCSAGGAVGLGYWGALVRRRGSFFSGVAEGILHHGAQYPVALWDVAEGIVAEKVAAKSKQVGRVAAEQGWF
jgi:hypothetical protein